MPESYQLILNTQGANVLDKTNAAAVKFSVNWASFLPKYTKFHCQFVFKSIIAAVAISSGIVKINMGQINNSDGTSMSQNIGTVYPVLPTNASCYLTCSSNDNNDFYISYPSNQLITVNLVQFDNITALANAPDYILSINFRGVEE